MVTGRNPAAGLDRDRRDRIHIDFRSDEFPGCFEDHFVSWKMPGGGIRWQQGPGQVDELWILDVGGFRLLIDAGYWHETPRQDLAELRRVEDSVRIERDRP